MGGFLSCLLSCFAPKNLLFSVVGLKIFFGAERPVEFTIRSDVFMLFVERWSESGCIFFLGECVSACACARKPLLTEAQGVASCSRDRTGPSGYNQNKEAHWGKHNKKTFPQVLLLH